MDHDVAFASFMAPMPFRAPSFSFDPTRRASEDFLFHSHDYSGFGVPQGMHQPAAQLPATAYLNTTAAYIPAGRGSFSVPYSFLGPEQPSFMHPVSYYGVPYSDVDTAHLFERPRQFSLSAPAPLAPSVKQSFPPLASDPHKADAYGTSGWAYLFPDSQHAGAVDASPLNASLKSETASELPSPASTVHSRSSESHEVDMEEADDADNEPATPAEDSRDWACPVSNCGKSYRFKGDLKYHVKRKHPERLDLPSTISKPRSAKEGKSYPCPVATCACGFKWARDLRRHIKTKHPENEEDSTSSGSSTPSRSKHSKSTRAKAKLQASKAGSKAKGASNATASATAAPFVTLSISSFYDDSDSMLHLPESSERN